MYYLYRVIKNNIMETTEIILVVVGIVSIVSIAGIKSGVYKMFHLSISE